MPKLDLEKDEVLTKMACLKTEQQCRHFVSSLVNSLLCGLPSGFTLAPCKWLNTCGLKPTLHLLGASEEPCLMGFQVGDGVFVQLERSEKKSFVVTLCLFRKPI